MTLAEQPIQARGLCESATHRIWIAGPIAETEQACAEFCTDRGFCVAIEPVRYVYTGGREDGAVVTVLNYPRFPKQPQQVCDIADELARFLIERVCQGSATVEGPGQSVFLSRREGDQ